MRQVWRLLFCVFAVQATAQENAAQTQTAASCERSLTRSDRLGKGPICRGALIFEDNFDVLDHSKWSHEVTMAGGGNNEFQVYSNDARSSFTQGGNLMLNPVKLADLFGEEFLTSGTIDLGENCTASWNDGCVRTGSPESYLPPIGSARLHTVNTFSFMYGNLEVRAKMPAGDWLWPAIWMMPRDSTYGDWPVSGDFDLVESRGNRDLGSFDGGVNLGAEQVKALINWGPDGAHNQFARTYFERNSEVGQGYDEEFHLYNLEWTPESIAFSIDNITLGTVTPPAGGFYELGEFAAEGIENPWIEGDFMAPFDQEFYLIVSLAVGSTGGYFADGVSNPGGKPWTNNSPHPFKEFWDGRAQWEPTWLQDGSNNLQVDYVRVWAL